MKRENDFLLEKPTVDKSTLNSETEDEDEMFYIPTKLDPRTVIDENRTFSAPKVDNRDKIMVICVVQKIR